MRNVLPSSIQIYTDRIETAIGTWPVEVSIDHVIKWVLQFDVADYPLAVRIIEHLDVLGSVQIRSALEVAHAKLQRRISEKGVAIKGNNTLYAGIGNAAKSGALISHHYRVTVDIPEDDFYFGDDEDKLDLSSIDNIVLVDDVIGTGKTIAKEVKRVAEEVYSLAKPRQIFVLTVAGYEDGIQRVTEDTGASVVTALEYSSRDTVTNMDAAIYTGLAMSEREAALERIRRYCRSISTSELGFGGVGGLLVFDHNTPNTTLPIIWHRGRGWLPLFPRSLRIPGSAKVLRSAEAERGKDEEKTDAGGTATPREQVEITLFVEGKIDELFIDFMRQERELAIKLKVKDVRSVSLGGLYQSERLLALLRTSKKEAIFVLDDDEHSRRASSRLNVLNGVQTVYLKPSFVAMLDLNKIYENRDRFPDLPEQTGPLEDPRWLHQVELAVLKRGPIGANSERIIQTISEFLDSSKYEEFVSELKRSVDIVLERT
ncbi:phosphoribosyltransferase [Burkholderia sp. S-53]|uniref:phosphoribosyltransferase n=1 Tax=Burkholderia sp. S-53 TaxID=2906514 RepID=UPI0021D131D1|nr:phosphoribosyltransferase [Burkholderia sp. S-53]UXU92106.1 phosphoribosyltransferase [Burkholderia sp. S-53]